MKANFDTYHDELIKNIEPELAFDPFKYSPEYKKLLKEKLHEVLGIEQIRKNACELKVDIESVEERDNYTLTRFSVETEKNNFVPCFLLVPNTGKEKYDVCVVVQGHSVGGVMLSIGEATEEQQNARVGHKFAFQAVENGYAALCLEMRGRDQMMTKIPQRDNQNTLCTFPAFTSLLLGRCHIGERVWDLGRVLDILPMFDKLNLDNIIMTGCSGGGTMTFYASCYDERIKLSVPVASFCPYNESILNVYHCICNYIPGAYKYFDMQDLAALIAPRKLVIITGEKDAIFPLHGVERGYKTVEEIYKLEGKSEYLNKIIMPCAHAWMPEYVWPALNEMNKK